MKPLSIVHKNDGSIEYAYEIAVSEKQVAIIGKDPEFSDEEQVIKDVCWLQLHEISERDRAFLWSYGLMEVDGVWDEILSWGDEISYPQKMCS